MANSFRRNYRKQSLLTFSPVANSPPRISPNPARIPPLPRPPFPCSLLGPLALLALICVQRAAFGSAPVPDPDRFEIQVYEAEVNRPGQFGLELHSNYTIQGRKEAEYEGQIPPNHLARFTLEPALGVTDWFELGAYLQSLVAPDYGAKWGGAKLRAKLVVPERLHLPVFLGINLEIGHVPAAVADSGWANEFRPILGYRNGWVLVDVNPIFGYALSGPDQFKPDFQPAGKVAINTQAGFELGVEYYTSLGYWADGFSALRKQEHMLFAVMDLARPASEIQSEHEEDGWELNVAVGRGLTQGTGPDWIVKSIVGKAF
jgi:hypothetical protein